jgi:RNA polymerase sigma-70 factor (sigma-B/F/G subfamily)
MSARSTTVAPTFSRSAVASHLHAVGLNERHLDERAQLTQDLFRRAALARGAERRKIQEEIVLLNLEVAESIVVRYRNRGVSDDDLVQIACLGLVKAVRGYDFDKSDNFLSYAVPTIRGEVKRFFRDNAWVVRPPRRVQELQPEITQAVALLSQESGRAPTARELASDMGLEYDDVVEALAADGCYAPGSLDKSPNDDGSSPLSALLGDDDPGFDRAEAIVTLRPLCRSLSPRDRKIVYLRFFREWTQARIAEEFGVTQMQVSRLLARILKQLREQLGPRQEDEAPPKAS